MKNKKPMQVLVVILAVMFLSTVVQASEKNYKHSWYNPFAGIWKKIGDLDGNVKKMDRKINRMDRKINKLQVSGMAGPQGPAGKNARFICPGCNFSDSEEWANYNSPEVSRMAVSNAPEQDSGDNDLFAGAYLAHSYFDNGNFTGTNFSGANMHHSDLHQSLFFNADFSGANLKGASFSGSDLTGADFTGATLDEITWWNSVFGSIGWHPTICPDGTPADQVGNTCINNLVYY